MIPTVLLALLLVAPGSGGRTRAEAHYRAATELSAKAAWPEALAEYLRAAEIIETELEAEDQARLLPALCYEIGLSAEQLPGSTAIAVDAYERYLEQPPEKPNPSAREHARAFLERFQGGVGRIRVVGPVGARVLIDRRLAGQLPLRRPHVVAPGSHAIEVSARGLVPDPARLEAAVSAGESVEVDASPALHPPAVEPRAETGPPPSSVAPTAPPASEAGDKAIGWPWVLAGAGAIAAGVVIDTVPSSAHNGRLDATDVLPLLFYGAGAVLLGLGIWPAL